MLKENLGFHSYCLLIRLSMFCQGVFSIEIYTCETAKNCHAIYHCVAPEKTHQSMKGHWNFPWKRFEVTLRGTKIPFCGWGLNFFSPLKATNCYRTHLLSYFQFNALKGIKSPSYGRFEAKHPKR